MLLQHALGCLVLSMPVRQADPLYCCTTIVLKHLAVDLQCWHQNVKKQVISEAREAKCQETKDGLARQAARERLGRCTIFALRNFPWPKN